ncbi:MAG: hypothetical protein H6621_06890 [Halobacteriovoraceae bacterium]|nr:hypothetical protein [Halobacteriovoraceae bacterium]
MKKCTLLPINDNVDGAISYKVFNFVERELETSNWCAYRSNTELLNIFSTYRNKLNEYLGKPEVLKTVGDKLNVGSIIRINLEGKPAGISVEMMVYAGVEDVKYYENKTLVKSEDIDAINLTIRNWLAEYQKIIPYDGLVSGVLGDQITFDVGRSRNFKIGQEFNVRKFIKFHKHPLLKTVVEWETDLIGTGKIFNFSKNQAVGIIKVYKSSHKVGKDDWVIIDTTETPFEKKLDYPDIEANKFGKIGVVSFFPEIGDHSVKTSDGTVSRKINGIMFGGHAKAEAWITRNYFGIFEYGQRFGSLKKATDTVTNNTYSASRSVIKLMGGYRFLPLRFFYGPRFDVYAGWARYAYDIDFSQAEGFGENNISGIIAGLKIDMPLVKKMRAFLKAEVMPLSTFKQENQVFAQENSTSSVQFEIGGQYEWNKIMSIDGSLVVTNNKAGFNSGISDLKYQESVFRLGVSYQF